MGAGPRILARNTSAGKGGGWAPRARGTTFVRGRSLAPQSSDSLRSRNQASRRPRRFRGTAAMDIPPLAGKTAAMSLGALPVSYALNHISTLSQCVSSARTTGLEGG